MNSYLHKVFYTDCLSPWACEGSLPPTQWQDRSSENTDRPMFWISDHIRQSLVSTGQWTRPGLRKQVWTCSIPSLENLPCHPWKEVAKKHVLVLSVRLGGLMERPSVKPSASIAVHYIHWPWRRDPLSSDGREGCGPPHRLKLLASGQGRRKSPTAWVAWPPIWKS